MSSTNAQEKVLFFYFLAVLCISQTKIHTREKRKEKKVTPNTNWNLFSKSRH
jgi:hypothetical protein